MTDQEPATKAGTTRLTLWQLLCFNALSAPLSMGGLILVTMVPTYYAVDLGVGLGLVGLVFVAGRLFDVVSDPIVGHLSDITSTRFGPRVPWMIFGVPGFCLAVWLLFLPPEGASLAYLLVASGLYFLFHTILDVPYSSIGLEVSPDVHERSMLASFKAVFQVLGAAGAASLPFVFSLPTPAAFALSAKVIAASCLLGLVAFLIFVPKRKPDVQAPKVGLIKSFRLVFACRPYRILILAFSTVQVANALSASLTVLFVTHVIKAPELAGFFLALVLFSTAACLPVWLMLSKWRSKAFAWRCSILVCCSCLAFTPFLGAGDIWGLAIISFVVGGAIGCDAIMPTSMLADIVYDQQKGGENRLAGLCLAVKNAVSKMAFVVPMGLAFPVLDMMGFGEAGSNSSLNLMVLTFFFGLLPIGLKLVVFAMLKKTEPIFAVGLSRYG